jgi:predicted DNA-binding transcriptional regulator YafY
VVLGHTFNLTLDDPVSVSIRFSPEGARRVRDRQWSATQTIEEHPGGTVVLSMETSGRDDVVAWVLSFGPDAEVLEPAELRKMVNERAEAIVSQYR